MRVRNVLTTCQAIHTTSPINPAKRQIKRREFQGSVPTVECVGSVRTDGFTSRGRVDNRTSLQCLDTTAASLIKQGEASAPQGRCRPSSKAIQPVPFTRTGPAFACTPVAIGTSGPSGESDGMRLSAVECDRGGWSHSTADSRMTGSSPVRD